LDLEKGGTSSLFTTSPLLRSYPPSIRINSTGILTNMTGASLKIGIVGAGVAGLSAAIALRKVGHDVEVRIVLVCSCPESYHKTGL